MSRAGSALPRLLNAALLADFERALRAKGIDVDALAPGLTDAQIDAVVAPVGLRLPEEVRAWWRWRNGGPRGRSVYLLPRRVMLDLPAAIQSHAHDVRAGRGEYADPCSAVQPVDWSPSIFVRCVATGDVPAPVHVVHDWAAPSRLVLGSFGELVHVWLDLIERGVYVVDAGGGWSETQDLPADIVALGIG